MVFAVLYVLLVVKCLWTWKKMATAFTEQQQANKDENITRENIQRSKSAVERAKQAAGKAKNAYQKLQVNGQWFLWKLYVSELFESANQCLNLTTVYLCSLPVPFTASMCLLLALDCFHTGWTITHKNTPARRDRQIKVDAMVDFFMRSASTYFNLFRVPNSNIYFGDVTDHVAANLFYASKIG
jgi:hypothetical protein